MENLTALVSFIPKGFQAFAAIAVGIAWIAVPILKEARERSRYWIAVQRHGEIVRVEAEAAKNAGASAKMGMPSFVYEDSVAFLQSLRPDLARRLAWGKRALWVALGAVGAMLVLVIVWTTNHVLAIGGALAAGALHVVVATLVGASLYKAKNWHSAVLVGVFGALVLHLVLALAVGFNGKTPTRPDDSLFGLVGGLQRNDVSLLFSIDRQGSQIQKQHYALVEPSLDRLRVRGLVDVHKLSAVRPEDMIAEIKVTELGSMWREQFVTEGVESLRPPRR